MRTVSGILASTMQTGDLDVWLLDLDQPYTLDSAYGGVGSQKGQPITMTLIKLPCPTHRQHPLPEFDEERVVLISVQISDEQSLATTTRRKNNATRPCAAMDFPSTEAPFGPGAS